MDVLTAEQRRRNMQANKSAGTDCESLLAKALWNRGYRYRKNVKTVMGKPDIVFKKFRVAIFCDGEFWHGKDWEIKRPKISVNRQYWIAKIENNIRRDRLTTENLQKAGWAVVRFWSKEITKDVSSCVDYIERVIRQRKQD